MNTLIMLACCAALSTNSGFIVEATDTNGLSSIIMEDWPPLTNYYEYTTFLINDYEELFLEPATEIQIGPVIIDCETGNVTVDPRFDLNEASKAFWFTLEQMYPEMFERKKEVEE